MSLHKLCFVTILTTIVAFVPTRRLNIQTKEFDLLTPSSRSDAVLVPDEASWYMGQPAKAQDRSHRLKLREKSEIPPAVLLPVQSKNADDLGVGKLLVASRNLDDPNFAQTVLLLVHYDAQGVVGLILNRRTNLPLSRAFEGLKAAKDRSDPVYLGGPLETPAAFPLLQSLTKVEGAEHIFGGVYLISTKALLEKTIAARTDPSMFRVYLGYAGWTREQLRMEVQLGSWFIFQADARTVFNSNPDSLWSQMISQTELKSATIEPAEADPSSGAPALGIVCPFTAGINLH